MPTPPPPHVLAAFGLAGETPPESLSTTGTVFRTGSAVLKRAPDPAEAAWLAGTVEHLSVPGVRLARPIRASDGRWVVGGWTAQRFVAGEPEALHDRTIEIALLLDSALAPVPESRLLTARTDLYSTADEAAWSDGPLSDGPLPTGLGDGAGARLFIELAAERGTVDLPNQLIHRDLFGNVLFAPDQDPAVIDLTPTWRPPGWAAAIVVVDAVSWGGADVETFQRWNHLPAWSELVRRALLFRLAVSLLHPRTTPSSLVEIMTGVAVLRPLLTP